MNSELLLAHFDRISGAPDAVPRLRRFVLDLAVRGKLVDQNPGEEPASGLMSRIEGRKLQLAGSRVPTRHATESVSNDEVPFELPSNWIWVRLGDICSKTGSGSTPRGGKSVYQSAG